MPLISVIGLPTKLCAFGMKYATSETIIQAKISLVRLWDGFSLSNLRPLNSPLKLKGPSKGRAPVPDRPPSRSSSGLNQPFVISTMQRYWCVAGIRLVAIIACWIRNQHCRTTDTFSLLRRTIAKLINNILPDEIHAMHDSDGRWRKFHCCLSCPFEPQGPTISIIQLHSRFNQYTTKISLNWLSRYAKV